MNAVKIKTYMGSMRLKPDNGIEFTKRLWLGMKTETTHNLETNVEDPANFVVAGEESLIALNEVILSKGDDISDAKVEENVISEQLRDVSKELRMFTTGLTDSRSTTSTPSVSDPNRTPKRFQPKPRSELAGNFVESLKVAFDVEVIKNDEAQDDRIRNIAGKHLDEIVHDLEHPNQRIEMLIQRQGALMEQKKQWNRLLYRLIAEKEVLVNERNIVSKMVETERAKLRT